MPNFTAALHVVALSDAGVCCSGLLGGERVLAPAATIRRLGSAARAGKRLDQRRPKGKIHVPRRRGGAERCRKAEGVGAGRGLILSDPSEVRIPLRHVASVALHPPAYTTETLMGDRYDNAADAEADRQQLKNLLAALGAWDRALRRDECGAWCIHGTRGTIHTWGDGKTWVLYVACRSSLHWTHTKRQGYRI
jgi:hypothetical protein